MKDITNIRIKAIAVLEQTEKVKFVTKPTATAGEPLRREWHGYKAMRQAYRALHEPSWQKADQYLTQAEINLMKYKGEVPV